MNNGILRARPAIALFLLGVVYAVASLATIKTYQLPWFDEIVYIDVARSFHMDSTLYPSVLSLSSETLHSPLHSVLTSWIFELFGFGIVQARILPMIGAISVFMMLAWAVHKRTQSIGNVLLFMVLFISDRAINFAMHNGRMDMLCLCFATASLLWFAKLIRQPVSSLSILQTAGAGLLLAAAWLTSMRLAVAMSPCILLSLCYTSGDRRSELKYITAFGFAAALPIVIWLWYAYGGVAQAVEANASTSVYQAHFGLLNSFVGNVLRRFNEAPKMILFYVLCIWLLIRHRRILRSDFFVCANLLTIAGFVLFVTEKGPYRSMFLPFMYYLGTVSISISNSETVQTWMRYACIAVIGLNIASSTPRIAYLACYHRELDAKQATRRLGRHVQTGSRVIADMQFYYILRELGAEIRVVELDKLDSVEYRNGLTMEFKPQYILSNQPRTLEIMQGKTLINPTKKHDCIHPFIQRILHSKDIIMPKEVYDAKLIELDS